ncbi:MAG: lysophospholipid acyltransferase family protein [Elusimicrobia bacterium]|nr:lysophospholipid acyltransferase family protein [Elusimicrobiota bacterium]
MNILDKLLINIGFFYIWLVGKTSRTVVDNAPEYEELYKNKKPVIFTFWHGRQIYLVWAHRNEGVYILVSKSRDGGYITGITEKFGCKNVRGSTSRGGFEALCSLVEKGKAGNPIAFTPDGPRGPLKKVQPGVLVVAQKTGLPIIPMSSSAKRKYIVRNWDEFHIPFPFGKVALCHGKPIYIKENDDIQEKSKELEIALDEITAKSDSLI